MKSMNLDTARQEGLYAQAVREMQACIPGWSDRYPSDPAVAILEYLTYLTDLQSNYVNQVEDTHYRAYLHLLGGTVRQRKPAKLYAIRQEGKSYAAGERYTIDDIPFEVQKSVDGMLPAICSVEWNQDSIRQTQLPMDIPGGQNGSWTVRLTGPLTAHKPVSLWCGVAAEPGRNPPAEDTPAPVRLSVRVGKTLVDCQDGTCGFLQSGFLTFTPAERDQEIEILVRGRWEGKPRIAQMVLEPLSLAQQQTRSLYRDLIPPFCLPPDWVGNRVLHFFTPEQGGWKKQPKFYPQDGRIAGWTDAAPEKIRVVAMEPDFAGSFPLRGISMEEYKLDAPGLCTLELLMEQDGLWYECPVCLPVEGKTLDHGCRLENGTLRFGDGRDYRIPKPGNILISRCILTGGKAVNGAGGILTGKNGSLRALTNAAGGQNAETPKEAFFRCAEDQETRLRAVSCADYAEFARNTPGLALDRVRAVPKKALDEEGPGVVILVKPHLGSLTPWQRERILAYLDPVRMMGVPVEIRGAKYCDIKLRVSLETTEPISPEAFRKAVLPMADGVEGSLDFGSEVSYTALYSALSSLPHVRFIRRLELISRTARRTQDGSLRLQPDMLPCLETLEILK